MNETGNKNETIENDGMRKDAMEGLKKICDDMSINIYVEELELQYFNYYEDKKLIIICPSAQTKHIDLLKSFLLS